MQFSLFSNPQHPLFMINGFHDTTNAFHSATYISVSRPSARVIVTRLYFSSYSSTGIDSSLVSHLILRSSSVPLDAISLSVRNLIHIVCAALISSRSPSIAPKRLYDIAISLKPAVIVKPAIAVAASTSSNVKPLCRISLHHVAQRSIFSASGNFNVKSLAVHEGVDRVGNISHIRKRYSVH